MKRQIKSMYDLVAYETSNYRIASFISNNYIQGKISKYLVKKTAKKLKNYCDYMDFVEYKVDKLSNQNKGK